MPRPKYSQGRSRRRRTRRHVGVWLAAFCIVGIILALVTARNAGHSTPSTIASSLRLPGRPVNVAAIANQDARSRRAVYQYSVIPGGAYTQSEFADAINRDPVVAAHYRSVSLGAMHPEKIQESRLAYVSYRIGDQIYWTRHKVQLHKGETILTDGVNQVRGRCGNCISLEPMGPAAENEPDALQLDALTGAPNLPPPTPTPSTAAAPPVSAAASIPMADALPLLFGSVPLSALNTPAFSSVPQGNAPSTSGASNSGTSSTDLPPSASPPLAETLPPVFTPFPSDTPPLPPIPPVTTTGGGTPPPALVPPGVGIPPVITVTPDAPVPPTPPPGPQVNAVPEPGTLLLVGGGLAVRLLRRRRSRSASVVT